MRPNIRYVELFLAIVLIMYVACGLWDYMALFYILISYGLVRFIESLVDHFKDEHERLRDHYERTLEAKKKE